MVKFEGNLQIRPYVSGNKAKIATSNLQLNLLANTGFGFGSAPKLQACSCFEHG